MKGPIRPMYKTASYHKLYRANPQKTKPKIRNATMTSLAGTALEMLNPSIRDGNEYALGREVNETVVRDALPFASNRNYMWRTTQLKKVAHHRKKCSTFRLAAFQIEPPPVALGRQSRLMHRRWRWSLPEVVCIVVLLHFRDPSATTQS
ncbi:hypothetical protein I7I51_01782 [Histoplasma capsulatum]|uniref:Uncharacterized protein n=1 Tax=Ajellomyces capsulatus TaxID=5037 RepID=A0A8A1MFL5_AJECA|nr:hypothetical protein I7I51_01782 [Histoplasma capsulatum]